MTKKDLNYIARADKARQDLLDSVTSINATLKDEKIRVQLYSRNGNLGLRYYDPSGLQKQISPRQISLDRSGIENARRMAYQIREAIQSGLYSDKWLAESIYQKVDKKTVVKILTWGEVIDDWQKRWLTVRSSDTSSTDRQKQVTLAGYITQLRLTGSVDPGTPFDKDLIDQLLATQAEGTNHRFRLREVLSVITNLYGINYNYRGIGKRPKPARRSIPSDVAIIEMFDLFTAISVKAQSDKSQVPQYQWYFGLLSTYGLRPQELFGIDLGKSFKPETAYWICLDEKLTDGLKTGDRWVAPLHPEWVELFDLANPKPRTFEYTDVEKKSRSVARYLVTHKIPCRPYDLRHAYAIRCRRMGIPLIDSADSLGHDPQTHHRQYQRWIDIESRIESCRSALERNNE